MNNPLGTTTVTQVAIIVRDIEAKAHAWAHILGLPMPAIIVTDPVEVAQTKYRGQPSPARAKLAFLNLARREPPSHCLPNPGDARQAGLPGREWHPARPARRV